MVKLSSIVGLLAATLATASAAQHSHQDVVTFSPVLKNRGQFKVYDKPVSVTADSSTQTASFVGNTKKDSAVKSKADIAVAYLAKNHNIPAQNIKVTDAYTDARSGITHVYVRQTSGGVDVANGLANVNVDSKGRIISSSQSFASADALSKVKRSNGSLVARASDDASLKNAFKSLNDYVKTAVSDSDLSKITVASTASLVGGDPQFTISNVPQKSAVDGSATAKKALIQKADGSLAHVWEITLQQADHWWSAHVNQDTGSVEAINDWVSHAESYNVYPRNVNDPLEGSRSIVSSPANTNASPKGWVTGTTTTGNNVWAQNNPTGGSTWKNNYRPNSSNGAFNFPLDLTKAPSSYIDSAITQLFYTVNTMHDLSFLYGFTEAAGNFQDVNYSGSGVGGDYVVAFAQDGSGTNNANFATPPDGQNGVMRMYTWTQTNPNRDGDFEQDIVAHEFTHGISNRLTGGPSNTNCLNDGEAGGMGEGWSDTVANLMRLKSGDTRSRDLLLGQYVYGQGIRNYPYSTSTSTNPSTYGYLDDPNYQEVHAIGEVWAGDPPCNPTFIDARDAIIQAEQNLTGGKNNCAIWNGFAKRGLGVNASSDSSSHTEDYTVPSGC
ncbi:hypothetical protein DL89DRAFT_284380 [Linderina pennispora]|uniref:Extracellular metalloproteinase n=1 Tax=Linderina pennispora TaxID=61395 RepID=A0A1Y1W654_9FUNG|nr:uncharacterized protein DL89DRAFT_284380 [Linderina pennispora]ORX69030.1 hypothetical protein DL89DRAFT_284380 [Linderina pennispora]